MIVVLSLLPRRPQAQTKRRFQLRQNRIDDILAVVQGYFIDSGNPSYNSDTDRTLVGPNAWNLGPPNGQQRVDDILNMLHQYFHDCV